MSTLTLAKDEKLFEKNSPITTIYVILSGKVGIFLTEAQHVTTLSKCQVVGERALMSQEKEHSKTAIAMDDTLLWCIDIEDFMSKIMFFEIKQRQRRLQSVKELSFFKGLPVHRQSLINSKLSFISVGPQHVLYDIGDAPVCFYIVLSG